MTRLQNPSGFCFLVQIKAFVIQPSPGLPKFKYQRKKEEDSGRTSKMTPSCKWPLVVQQVLCSSGSRDLSHAKIMGYNLKNAID